MRVSGPETTPGCVSSSINLDLITSDQYAQAYLDHLFSGRGPVAGLQNYFNKASDHLKTLITQPGCKNKTVLKSGMERSDGAHFEDQAEGTSEEPGVDSPKDDKQGETEKRGRREEVKERVQRDESLKLSIVETQPDESLAHNHHSATGE